uniref:Uncharacterized protein n=1 Tax=Setaria italica TaxID=4555 RepID=K3YMX5_SETIT
MALWDALAPAGAVAQLVGTDAAGLVSATLQAVRTARRNRKECHTLARRVMTVGDLLQLVVQHGRRSSSGTCRPRSTPTSFVGSATSTSPSVSIGFSACLSLRTPPSRSWRWYQPVLPRAIWNLKLGKIQLTGLNGAGVIGSIPVGGACSFCCAGGVWSFCCTEELAPSPSTSRRGRRRKKRQTS